MSEDEVKLFEMINKIKPLDMESLKSAEEYQSHLAIPPGSLGLLQEIGIRLSGITSKLHNVINKKRIIVLCADNGIFEEGVASTPQEVTALQAVNMTKGLSGMASLAKHFGNEVQVVDIGIATEYSCNEILNYSMAKGTRNICKSSAMNREDAVKCILTGIMLAEKASEEKVNAVGVGEMGIGNTSTSTAVLCALTGLSTLEVTGRGGGLTDAAFENKKKKISEALEINNPDPKDVIDVLCKVGGFDIAAMCGVFSGCALHRIPVVIDGYISIVAALCAYRLNPLAKEYFFSSHCSEEKGYLYAAKELNLKPCLNLNMRLGEGSGCPLAFQILDAACVIMNETASFEKSNIDDSYLETLKES